MHETLRTLLLAEPPAFHHWGGLPQTGGLDAPLLEFIERVITDAGASNGVAYETGAGLSSVWLLCLGLREVHSFCSKVEVCERIEDFLGQFPDERARWRCHIGPSQLTLPTHAIAMPTAEADFCLVDGGHGLDTVFNDFVYMNYLLKSGGLLAIDDLQLGSCRLLADWLVHGGVGYAVVGRTPKFAVLRKERTTRLTGDFGCQRPFLEKLSGLLDDAR